MSVLSTPTFSGLSGVSSGIRLRKTWAYFFVPWSSEAGVVPGLIGHNGGTHTESACAPSTPDGLQRHQRWPLGVGRLYGPLAQMAEQLIRNQPVGGSIPSGTSSCTDAACQRRVRVYPRCERSLPERQLDSLTARTESPGGHGKDRVQGGVRSRSGESRPSVHIYGGTGELSWGEVCEPLRLTRSAFFREPPACTKCGVVEWPRARLIDGVWVYYCQDCGATR